MQDPLWASGLYLWCTSSSHEMAIQRWRTSLHREVKWQVTVNVTFRQQVSYRQRLQSMLDTPVMQSTRKGTVLVL